ncbi:MAG: sigma-70 family RNA polymerase sigma factor [bacterium]
MQDETDENLLIYAQFADSDPADAERAASEFCRRYQKSLTLACEAICSRFSDLGLAGEDLANMTLLHALERGETYLPPEDLARQYLHTMGWLVVSAKNRAIDYIRNPKRGTVKLKDAMGSQSVAAQDVAEFLLSTGKLEADTSEMDRIVEAFSELDERSQFVLIMTLEMSLGSPGEEYMVRGTASELATHLGVTPEAVRQIRRRALKAIEARLKGASR